MRAYDLLLRYPLPFLLVAEAYSQSIASLPQCWQDCINQNGYSCSDSDLNCLCALTSSTPFLPGLLICVSKSCPPTDESKFDPSVFISSLQHDCSTNGNPLPSSILSDASLVAQSTGDAGVLITLYSQTTSMVTGVETDVAGNTHAVTTPAVIVYPVTISNTGTQSSGSAILSSASPSDSTEMASPSSTVTSSIGSTAAISTPTTSTGTTISGSSSSTSLAVTSNTDSPVSTAIGSTFSPSSSSTAAAKSTSNGSLFTAQSAVSPRFSSPSWLSADLLVVLISSRFLY